jgi:hypothetical protein
MRDNWCSTLTQPYFYTQYDLDLYKAWHEYNDANPKAAEFCGSFHVFAAGFKAARPRPEHDPIIKRVDRDGTATWLIQERIKDDHVRGRDQAAEA